MFKLNDMGNKLLYRDTRSSLFLYHIETAKTSNMIDFCTYVQWVPQSDVVVAQSNDQLCVWYNTDHIEQVTQFPIQGDVEAVLRDENRTEVIVHVSTSTILPPSTPYLPIAAFRRTTPRLPTSWIVP